MSNLSSFSNKLFFAVEKAKKSIIWLETFDYGYILNSLETIHNNKNEILHWDASTCETSIYGTEEVVDNGYLGNAIRTIESRSEKILIARVTEAMFAKDGNENEERLVPRIQHFVLWNDRNEVDSKKTLILVAATHFEVLGLEHICERLTIPLPDIEDIDEALGFIKTDELIRDKKTNRVISVGDLKRVLQLVENDSYETKNDETGKIEQKQCYIIKKDKANGLILRDEQNRVMDILFSDRHKLKYPFSKDFCENEEVFKAHYQELVDALCGMYIYDIKELLESLKTKGENNEIQYQYDKEGKLLEIISERKKQIVNNSGLLEVIDYDENHWMEVADIDVLLRHVEKEKARINFPGNYPPKMPKPKGILLVGAPGCGKSESAKAIASKLEKPLYRLNIGNLLGHKYGQSENRFIEALQTADASAPCVLWIDEIEKAFAGAGNESENDDTLTHIVGYFLTWMQEHKTMVYLVATANDISRMKPEMLRKGRWDETFYLSFPSKEGCKNIIKTISENKFKLNLKGFENNEHVETIAEIMSKIPMSGAEIENIIVETIKERPQSEEGHWCISVDNIAITFLGYLREKDDLSETMSKNMANEEINDIWEDIKNYGSKLESANIEKDPFINAKIEAEKLELQIKGLGQLSDVHLKELEKVLKEKYKNQYKFKRACIL